MSKMSLSNICNKDMKRRQNISKINNEPNDFNDSRAPKH